VLAPGGALMTLLAERLAGETHIVRVNDPD
jgi:hypothetical protein